VHDSSHCFSCLRIFRHTTTFMCSYKKQSRDCDVVTSQATLVDQNDQSNNWNYCDWCILLIIDLREVVYHRAETTLLTLPAKEHIIPKVAVNCVRISEKFRSHTTLNDKWSSQGRSVTPTNIIWIPVLHIKMPMTTFLLIIILLSVGPAETHIAHCSLSRLIVLNPALVPPFIFRGTPRQTEWETSISERRNYGREMAGKM
jgi:hypothetical protein